MNRPSEFYIHGRDSVVVVVPARVCFFLSRYARLDDYARKFAGQDAEIDNVLQAIRLAGMRGKRDALGQDRAPTADTRPVSGWLTTTDVADRLGITDRSVRRLIAKHQLQAEKVQDRWQISHDALQRFKRNREHTA